MSSNTTHMTFQVQYYLFFEKIFKGKFHIYYIYAKKFFPQGKSAVSRIFCLS